MPNISYKRYFYPFENVPYYESVYNKDLDKKRQIYVKQKNDDYVMEHFNYVNCLRNKIAFIVLLILLVILFFRIK